MNACPAADPVIGFNCDQLPGHDDRHTAHTWDGMLLASWPQGSHLAPPAGYQLPSISIPPQDA